MRAPSSIRQFLMLSIGLLSLACAGTPASRAQTEPRPVTAIRFSLDHPVDALAAPFVLASTKGYFSSGGLAVTTTVANGSADAIARVAAGTSDLALADINDLVRFRDRVGAPAVKAVFVLFNAAPYAIVARKSRGINALSDIEGKSLAVAAGDASIGLWPSLARQNGINDQLVKQQHISAAVREPILSAGQIDAVTGLSYLSAVNLRDRGVPADDLAVLHFADYGCKAYGMAVIVNPVFALDKPDAVRAFLRAVTAGLRLTLEQPAMAVDAVMGQMDGGSRELELERLQAAIRDNIRTAEVMRNGLGDIDETRFNQSIDQIAVGFRFHKQPTASDIFDGTFLPPIEQRKIR